MTALQLLNQHFPQDISKIILSYNQCQRDHVHDLLCATTFGDYETCVKYIDLASSSIFEKALQAAYRTNYSGIVELYAKYVTIFPPFVKNALFGACQGNHIQHIDKLIKNYFLSGTDITLALNELVTYWHFETLFQVLERDDVFGYDVNWVAETAVSFGVETEIIDKLIEYGANDIEDFLECAQISGFVHLVVHFEKLLERYNKYL